MKHFLGRGSGGQFHTNHCIMSIRASSWCLCLQECEKGLLGGLLREIRRYFELFILLYAYDFLRTPNVGIGKRCYNYFCYGAACSEVEIDCLTGDHQVWKNSFFLL